MLEVLKNRNFLSLWLARLVSRLGDGIHTIALAWLVLELTGSALTMGTTMAISVLPNLLFGLPAGDFVDKLNRKYLMIGCDLCRFLVVLVIPFTYFVGILEVWMIYLVGFLASTAETLFNPSLRSTIPNIVKEGNLNSANSLDQITTSLSSLFGLSAGGAVVALVGAANAFYLDSLSFFLSASFIGLVTVPEVGRGKMRGLFTDLVSRVKEGVRYVRESEFLKRLIPLAIGLNFVGTPIFVLIPYFVRNVLQGGSQIYGFMMASISVGTLLGSIYIGNVKVATGRAIILGITEMGLSVLLFTVLYQVISTTHLLPWAGLIALLIVCLIGVGIGNSVANVSLNSFLQAKTSDEKRGRVLSIVRTGAMSAMPISYGLSGFLIERLGAMTILYGIGAFTLLGAVLSYVSEPIREAHL